MHRYSSMHRTLVLTATLVMLLALLVAQPPAVHAADNEFSDTLQIVKDDETPSAAEIAVRLSEGTPLESSGTVLLGRSDVFADSLASGVLQGDSPLMLVPPQGPVPDRVLAELQRLDPTRVILLGGTSAIGEVVEQSLASSYQVERRSGVSRIETAIEIARQDAPQATSGILSRAFASAGSTDETQAFADALGAGGMAAEMGWPVLLTQSETLTRSTREYLATSQISTMYVVGGTAAISDQVVAELTAMGITTERVAGDTRSGTAVEIAKVRGAQSAADVARVTMVDSQSPDAWAGGFAAAAHSALFDAPVLLTAGTEVPPETLAFLQGGSQFAVPTTDLDGPVVTCVTRSAACETTRVALGLPPAATITFDPASATDLAPSQEITITVDTAAFTQAGEAPAEGEVRVDGSCLDQPVTAPLDGEPISVTASAAPPTPCELGVSLLLPNGSTQTTTAIYPGGAIEGVVRSATDGGPVPGAAVQLSNGLTTESGTDGTFTFTDLTPGEYAITASAADFQDSPPSPVDVLPAQVSAVDVLLSPLLTAGELRVVLSWDEDPQDLDSHLWLPASQPFHLYYANPGALGGCPDAELDIDDTSSFGPETVTIGVPHPGVYRYAVHLFSGNETLSQSSAVVQVYDATGLVETFEVPQNGTAAHIWWHVFDVDVGAGALTSVNRLATDQASVEPYPEQDGCAAP